MEMEKINSLSEITMDILMGPKWCIPDIKDDFKKREYMFMLFNANGIEVFDSTRNREYNDDYTHLSMSEMRPRVLSGLARHRPGLTLINTDLVIEFLKKRIEKEAQNGPDTTMDN